MRPTPAFAGRAAAIALASLLLVCAVVVGSAVRGRHDQSLPVATAAPVPVTGGAGPTFPLRTSRPQPAPFVPAAFVVNGLGLRAGPVATPLRLRIPSIGVDVTLLGVGVTTANVMDAPEGRAADPVWQQAFWYRGSAVPGADSTALIAGHIDDPLGRPGSFARIGELRAGALIVVHDMRTGTDVRFAVVGAVSYPLAATTDPAVLTRMYGSGPVDGLQPQPSADGRAHLTLVTCAGTFDNRLRTHDHRLAVYATRID